MGGLARICKAFGGITINGVRHVWDYANECSVLESEMMPGSKRWDESEIARWRETKTMNAQKMENKDGGF